MIGNLQLLRAFAALSVVWYHANLSLFGVHTDFSGVGVFFVISGFICCYVSAKRPEYFFSRRFMRVAPLYWFATLAMLCCFRMLTHWPWSHTVMSMLFIPHNSVAGLHPVLGVGWTLNIEMICYGVLGLALWLIPRHAFIFAAAIIYILHKACISLDTPLAFVAFGNPYPIFFIAGMGLWAVFSNRWSIKISSLYYFPAFLVVHCALSIWIVIHPSAIMSTLAYLSPIALVSIAVFTAKSDYDVRSKPILLLGGASYALYLFHTIVLEALRIKGMTIISAFDINFLIYLALSVVIAIIVHLRIEPLLKEDSLKRIVSSLKLRLRTSNLA